MQALRVVHYKYTEEFAETAGLSEDERADTGVIAQEVECILPDAVRPAGNIILPDGRQIENFLVVNKVFVKLLWPTVLNFCGKKFQLASWRAGQEMAWHRIFFFIRCKWKLEIFTN